jgi:hypothetical protein
MNPKPETRNPKPEFPSLALLALGAIALPAHGWQLATNLTLKADVTLKETFDSNVYLQDYAPSALVPNAAQPFEESFVTAVTPRLALDWKPLTEFGLAAFYAPEVVTFHAEPSESHVAHRTGVTFAGKVQDIVWEQFNTFTWIDGSEEGLTFGIIDPVTGKPVGAPAIGGIPLRDRREAIVYRNGFRAYHPLGRWFFRPVLASYIHDFRTEVRNPKEHPFYQNYVDRNDFNTGIEVGYRILKETHAVLGYRFGYQMEPPLPGSSVDYSNHYHRVVAGLEGKLAPWLKLNLSLGPAYHDFDHATPPNFDGHQVLLYVDSSAVLIPSVMDTVTLSVKQFMQPAFGAPSAYEDITYDVVWRHKFCDHAAFNIGFRAYGGDWLHPVQRDDWIFTPGAGFDVTINKHFSAAAAYSYDWVESYIPNTDGREFTRHLGSISARYAF